MAGKIMSLWIYSSISEVSWEGSAVLSGCLCMAQNSGDLVQLVKGTLFASLGKWCSSIAWKLGSVRVGAWIRKTGFLEWGFGVVLVMLQGQVCCEVAANFIVMAPAAPKKYGQPPWYSGLCNTIFLRLACRGSLSPPCVKDSGVACAQAQRWMWSVSMGI